jgi:hypothetical protein
MNADIDLYNFSYASNYMWILAILLVIVTIFTPSGKTISQSAHRYVHDAFWIWRTFPRNKLILTAHFSDDRGP